MINFLVAYVGKNIAGSFGKRGCERQKLWGALNQKRKYRRLSFGILIIVESPLIFHTLQKKLEKNYKKKKYKVHE